MDSATKRSCPEGDPDLSRRCSTNRFPGGRYQFQSRECLQEIITFKSLNMRNPDMTHWDHAGNANIMTSAIVAVVAVVSVIMIFSQGTAPTGLAAGTPDQWDQGIEAGKFCGNCAMQFGDTKTVPAGCADFMRAADNRMTEQCCRRKCDIIKAERCQTMCAKTALDVFTGRGRFSTSPYDVDRSSSTY